MSFVGITPESYCFYDGRPSTSGSVVFVIVLLLFLVESGWRGWIATSTNKHQVATLIFIALQALALFYYYNRYKRCDSVTGFFVYLLCNIVLGIAAAITMREDKPEDKRN